MQKRCWILSLMALAALSIACPGSSTGDADDTDLSDRAGDSTGDGDDIDTADSDGNTGDDDDIDMSDGSGDNTGDSDDIDMSDGSGDNTADSDDIDMSDGAGDNTADDDDIDMSDGAGDNTADDDDIDTSDGDDGNTGDSDDIDMSDGAGDNTADGDDDIDTSDGDDDDGIEDPIGNVAACEEAEGYLSELLTGCANGDPIDLSCEVYAGVDVDCIAVFQWYLEAQCVDGELVLPDESAPMCTEIDDGDDDGTGDDDNAELPDNVGACEEAEGYMNDLFMSCVEGADQLDFSCEVYEGLDVDCIPVFQWYFDAECIDEQVMFSDEPIPACT